MWTVAKLYADGAYSVRDGDQEVEILRTRCSCFGHGGIEPLTEGQALEIARVLNAIHQNRAAKVTADAKWIAGYERT